MRSPAAGRSRPAEGEGIQAMIPPSSRRRRPVPALASWLLGSTPSGGVAVASRGPARRGAKSRAKPPVDDRRDTAPPYRIVWSDGVAEIRLECGKANALNERSLEAIVRAFGEAEARGAIGVVLTGYDRFFSAGLDLVTLYERDRSAMDAFMRTFDETMLAVFAFPRPVVAAVVGHAVAGGCILALACEARVAVGEGIRIGLNEVRLGVPFPASALEIARHALPPPSLAPILGGGELYAPREALSLGLVDALAAGDAVEEARARCRRLAGGPPATVAAIKAALRQPALERARAGRDRLREAFVDAWFSPEGRRQVGEARARLLGEGR